MISGLREKMISTLISIGYDAAEVFTTDTHAVNAVVLGRRGYHPVGEVMDHAQLLSYIKTVALTAMERLKPSTSGALTLTVKNVRVIGQARIETLSVLVDQALQKAKGIVVPLFGLEGLLLILLLAIF
jgi:predicted neutral ceramidase superfamily lipid hydrolase